MLIILWLSRRISALPLARALWLGRMLARFWYYILPIRRGVARKNVRRVFGTTLTESEQRRMVRHCFESLGMYAVESLRLPAITPEISRQWVQVANIERIWQGLERGKGVIVPTAHMANWDLLGCSQALLGIPLNVIVKDVSWKPAHDFIFTVRHRTGFKTIAPRRSKDMIIAALQRNEVVAMIADQHMPPHRGIVCEFFGQKASTSPAVARFAYETGAAIFPAVDYRDPQSGRHWGRVEEEFLLESPHTSLNENIHHNTERLNRIIEGWIRAAPEQWLWLHKRWKVQDNRRSSRD